MDIKTLKLFCDVIQLKGLTQAAAANSITQSAVSQRIKSLEKQFGISLLERRGTELHVTKAGEAIYGAARRILSEFKEMEGRLQEIKGEEGGSVRIAAIYSVGLYELDRSVKKFLKNHPNVDVQIEYSRATQIYKDVISGSIDLGLVAYPPRKPQLASVPVSEDELVLICGPDHLFSRQSSISLNRLDSQPFVTFHRDVPTRKAIDEIFRSHGVSLAIKAEFDNIELIKRAVEIGLGIALVPALTVRSEIQAGLLRVVSLAEGPFIRPIAALYRRGRSLPSAAKKFIAVLTGNGL